MRQPFLLSLLQVVAAVSTQRSGCGAAAVSKLSGANEQCFCQYCRVEDVLSWPTSRLRCRLKVAASSGSLSEAQPEFVLISTSVRLSKHQRVLLILSAVFDEM